MIRNLFSWLVDKRYLLGNPFSNVKVRGADKTRVLEISHAFHDAERKLIRTIANQLRKKHGRQEEAAHRTRFILDCSYATRCTGASGSTTHPL